MGKAPTIPMQLISLIPMIFVLIEKVIFDYNILDTKL
ncbi:hypothetical protein J2S02_004907 [Metabacillus niabensis]|uniref:Uncharacterized protein n=1 Tax=Metabacillus niabensis TaxID=324854 RepID=A0ABT9Z8E5_9BACI|nr:hypothetical protein [Metabacillus niabensis]